jgi:argininosuccinate lyase
MKLWGGRFSGDMSDIALEFTRSVGFDARLFPFDIAVSKAHASALKDCGIFTEEELEKVLHALDDILSEMEEGSFRIAPTDEDIHTAIERSLVERLGEVGARMRTARSRNDQVAADMRLYLKREILYVCQQILNLGKALVEQAETNLGVVMPGFTHLQPAQPVLVSHHLLAYVEMFKRDIARFKDAYRRIDESPLGSGALAGVTFPLNREAIADDLGFSAITKNSIDAVSDRDFVADFCYALCMLAVHLSRLCEEIILWSNPQFGFLELDDAYATGSSLMPQKKNPDIAELVRGKSSQAIAVLIKILTLIKGLPLSYNRDFQEDKEATFRLIDEMKLGMHALEGMISTLSFNPARMEEAARLGYLNATDLADYLVRKGVPFLEAHEVAGRAVVLCQKRGITLEDLDIGEFQELDPRIGEDVYPHLSLDAAIAARDLPGGTSFRQVKLSLEKARAWLQEERENWREPFV